MKDYYEWLGAKAKDDSGNDYSVLYVAAAVFIFVSLIFLLVEPPGQYRGAYAWAKAQNYPTRVDFCRRDEWKRKICYLEQMDRSGSIKLVKGPNDVGWQVNQNTIDFE